MRREEFIERVRALIIERPLLSAFAASALPTLVCATLLLGCPSASTRAASKQDDARVLLERNKPEEALPLLDELHEKAPLDLGIARLRAEAYSKAGKSDDLLAKSTANTPVAHYTRGLLLFARPGQTAKAVEAFEAGVKLAPDEPELNYRLGIALLESESYERALPSLQRAAQLAPDRRAYQLPLAKALYRNGKQPEAVDALRKVALGQPTAQEVATAKQLMAQITDPFARFPKSQEGKLQTGMRWLNVADVPQQAIIAFEEILQEYPDQAGVHALLGLAYQRIDDAGRAVDEFKRSIELDPSQGRPHFYLGVLYASRQRSDQAREEFQKAIELDPFIEEAWGRMGDLALEAGDAAAAERAFTVMVHLSPDSVPPKAKLALALQLQKDFAGAERQLNDALLLAPDNVELKLRLGLLFTDKKRQSVRPEDRAAASERAEKWLREVLDTQPDNALASQALDAVRAM